MKTLVILACIGLCVSAVSVDVPLAQKQKDVLLLLSHINQQLVLDEWKPIVENYNVSEHIIEYSNPEVVHQFELYYPHDILPKGQIFSVLYQTQLNEAIALFKLLYYSKTYQTFYNTAVWARHHLNEGLFLYAYSVAVVHRPDTQEVVLPPIYEIYPYYFYDVAAIQQAYILKQTHSTQHPVQGYDQHHGYTVVANYSGYYLNLHPEQSLSYYLEDVGINAFYYYINLYYPFWLSGEEFGLVPVNRGAQYLFLYQQLLAHYYQERLSNNLGEIPYINWDVPLETPFYPSLEYPNGLEFPSRPAHVNLQEYYYNYGQTWTWKGPYGFSSIYIQDFESRLTNAIDHGYVINKVNDHKINLYTPEGLNVLGNIIESNPDSPDHQFYGNIGLFARHLLGYSSQPLDNHQIAPSVLEHFETSLRDPVFYQLYKKLLLKFYRYLHNYPAYTANDLIFPGVNIVNIQLDKLVTYNELFYSDISNVVYDSPEEILQDSFHIQVAQQRLNHKPFNYKITVNSEHDTKAVVKIVLLPQVDEYGRNITLSENIANFVLLDYFVQDLKTGENIITRNSHDSHLYSVDPLSYQQLYQQVVNAQHGKGEFSVQNNYLHFPHRYMLPQGSEQGVPYHFGVIVYPYVPSQVQQSGIYENIFYPYEGGKQFVDNYTLFYPFDRPIVHEHIWEQVPNVDVYETKIYHVDEVNVVHSSSVGA